MNKVDMNAYKSLGRQIAENRTTSLDHYDIKLNWKEALTSEIRVRDFEPFTVDEPAVIGGQDKGPNPIEYLLSGALGCFTVGVVLAASSKNVEIRSLEAELESDVDMSVFYDTVLGGEHGIAQSYIVLKVDSDASVEHIEEFAQHSLDYSPVLNSLRLPVKVIVEKK
ncbi:MAG: OsmC family protein [Anaerovoracaceae bacterium]|jgi:uncharacterized OsmC-like protein